MEIPQLYPYDSSEELAKAISKAEIVIGIPSRNVYHTIAYVVHNVVLGLERYAKDRRAAIVVCDGLSTDPTVEIVKVIRKFVSVPIVVVPNIVSSGKGGAIKTIIEAIHRYSDAEKVLLLDSDLRSISPEWIGVMLNALSEGCDYVAPLYRRHRFDATITNFIARPMTAALYGIDVRQPIGGDFAFDRRYLDIIARSRLWLYNPWSLYFGVDIMLTHTALAHRCTVCEADLKAKIHEAKDPAKHLKNMFIEVTGSLFITACEYIDTWKALNVSRDGIAKPKLVDRPEVPAIAPWTIRVDRDRARAVFVEGIESYRDTLVELLDRETIDLLLREETLRFGIDRDLWSTIAIEIYRKFAVESRPSRKALYLEILYTLWQGRLYRYYHEVEKLSDEEVEHVLYEEVLSFVEKRSKIL